MRTETVKTRQLTDDEHELIIKMDLIVSYEQLYKELLESSGGWVLKAIEKRFTAYGLVADKKVMILILYFADGAVAKCAQIIDYLKEYSDQNHRIFLSWSFFKYYLRTSGIPITN